MKCVGNEARKCDGVGASLSHSEDLVSLAKIANLMPAAAHTFWEFSSPYITISYKIFSNGGMESHSIFSRGFDYNQ